MSEDTPNISELLKSVLFPGEETLRAFAGKLRNEAESTEWNRSLNRIEGVAFLSIVFAGSLLAAFLIYKQSVIQEVVGFLGLPSLVTLTIAIVLIYLKVIIEIVTKIDKGESIILFLIQEGEDVPPITSLFLGGSFLMASVGMILALDLSLSQIIIFLSISLGLIGFFIVGVSCFARIAVIRNS